MADNPYNPLKQIPLHVKSFEANGKTYHILKSLPVTRYQVLQKYEHQFANGMSVFDNHKAWGEVAKNYNRNDHAANVILANNMQNGFARIDEGIVDAVHICALFMVTDDEDLTTITESQIDIKYKDWNKELIDMSFFLSHAAASCKGFTELYRQLFPNDLAKREN